MSENTIKNWNLANFRIVKSKIATIDMGDCVTYGLHIYEEGEPENGITIHDISPDKKRAEALLLLLKDNNVSVCHVRDVVEDFLEEEIRG